MGVGMSGSKMWPVMVPAPDKPVAKIWRTLPAGAGWFESFGVQSWLRTAPEKIAGAKGARLTA